MARIGSVIVGCLKVARPDRGPGPGVCQSARLWDCSLLVAPLSVRARRGGCDVVHTAGLHLKYWAIVAPPMERIGIDLGGSKIEIAVLDAAGARGAAQARRHAGGRLRRHPRCHRRARRGRRARARRALHRRRRDAGRAVARHGAREERQLHVPQRPGAQAGPRGAPRPRGPPRERRQLLRAVRGGGRRGARRAGRLRRDPRHRRGRRDRRGRQGPRGRQRDRGGVGTQPAAVAGGGRSPPAALLLRA